MSLLFKAIFIFRTSFFCEWCVGHFSIFFSFILRNDILQSAKKCDMTSFCLTSLHLDLNEAAKCVDIISFTFIHIASLLMAPTHTRTKYKMATIFGLAYEN